MNRMKLAAGLCVIAFLAACDDTPDNYSDVGSFERATGMKIDNPDAPNEGTFRGATGADPGTANMVKCSDGKLYEDCRNSPMGY